MTRGIRNNNPGNIRLVENVHWQGQSIDQLDGVFIQFDTPEYGIRAMAKILLHYQSVGINTIKACINRWAPPSENLTDAYVDAVAKACHLDPIDVIKLSDIMPDLIKAIIFHENGEQPYTDSQIESGINLV